MTILLQEGDRCGRSGRRLRGEDMRLCQGCEHHQGGVLGFRPGTMNAISCSHPGSRKEDAP